MKSFRITLKTEKTITIYGINLMFALWAAGIDLNELKHWAPL